MANPISDSPDPEAPKRGRPGIDYAQVAAAAQEMADRGVKPTIILVRNAIGGGSNSTVGRHLLVWFARQEQADSLTAPESVKGQVLQALEQGWSAMRAQADARVERRLRLAEEQLLELDTAFIEAQSQRDQALRESALLRESADQARRAAAQREQELQAAQTTLAAERKRAQEALETERRERQEALEAQRQAHHSTLATMAALEEDQTRRQQSQAEQLIEERQKAQAALEKAQEALEVQRQALETERRERQEALEAQRQAHRSVLGGLEGQARQLDERVQHLTAELVLERQRTEAERGRIDQIIELLKLRLPEPKQKERTRRREAGLPSPTGSSIRAG